MYFTFKGTSSEAFSITVNKMPTFKKAKRRHEIVEVEGKDGVDIIEDGYEPYVLEALITLNDTTQLDSVIAWLDGSGVLTRSDDQGKYLNATVLEEVDYERLYQRKQTTVEFFIRDPFRYVTGETPVVLDSFPTTITLGGTYESEPLLVIVGSGSVDITINGTTFSYAFPAGESVTIDCAAKEATYNGAPRTQYMAGDFPTLSIGSNAVSKTGTVTSITVTKRTRYL